MRYLLVDGWGDYSLISGNNRINNLNPLFLQLATLLKQIGNNSFYWDARDNGFTKNRLNDFINKHNIEYLIFYANIDNVNSIKRNELEIDSMIFSINEDLSSIVSSNKYKYFNFDEKNGLEKNFISLFALLDIELDSELIRITPIDYSLCEIKRDKTVQINIGNGCARKCNFCSISNSLESFRDIASVMQEIDSLLKQGVKYFHIMNHNFASNRNYIIELCHFLIKKSIKHTFSWSCYITPSQFIDKLDLLELMSKSNLKKIEIGVESGSKKILKSLNLDYSINDIEKIVCEIVSFKIPIIGVHFLVGSLNESISTLEETKLCISRILFLTGGFSDIYLNCFFDENQEYPSIVDTILRKKSGFVNKTKYLSCEFLNAYLIKLEKEIDILRKEMISKSSLESKFYQYDVYDKYKIVSQAYRNYIQKTWYETMFRRKSVYKHIYFMWEIETVIGDYVPRLSYIHYIPNEAIKNDMSNIYIVLFNHIRQGYTVNELAEIIANETNGKFDKNALLCTLKEMENNYPLYYTKLLK